MKVRIQATETVRYDKVVEMTEEEFAELNEMLDESDGEKLYADCVWLDSAVDIVDSDGLEDVYVSKVD